MSVKNRCKADGCTFVAVGAGATDRAREMNRHVEYVAREIGAAEAEEHGGRGR